MPFGRHHLPSGQAADDLDVGRKTIDRYLSDELEMPQRVFLASRDLDPLRFYKSTPIDLDHNDWRMSRRHAPAIVRAQDVTLARWQAAKTFVVAARRCGGDAASPRNPWLSDQRAGAAEIHPTRPMSADGRVGVIQPAQS